MTHYADRTPGPLSRPPERDGAPGQEPGYDPTAPNDAVPGFQRMVRAAVRRRLLVPKLAARRTKLGLTPEEVAAATGGAMSADDVTAYERNLLDPTQSQFSWYCMALGVHVVGGHVLPLPRSRAGAVVLRASSEGRQSHL